MRVLDTDTGDGRTHVIEEIQGKIFRFLQKAAEFARLLQTFADGRGIGEESYLGGFFFSEGGEAVVCQHPSDFGETDFLFKILGINHVE